jgi:hypothetical protein
MNEKQKWLAQLHQELARWEDLLRDKSEAELAAPPPNADLSLKDIVAHLYAWQQVTVARLEAGLHHREPHYPAWTMGHHPDEYERTDEFNATIQALYRDQPGSSVIHQWRENFNHLLELAEAIPEADLLDPNQYPWMDGYALVAVLEGTYEHHEEHREQLRA